MTRKELDRIRTIVTNINHSINIINSIVNIDALNYRTRQILTDIEDRIEKDSIIIQEVIASNWLQQRELDRIQKEHEKEEDEYNNIIKFSSSYKF